MNKRSLILALGGMLLMTTVGTPQAPPRFIPRLEPVAETRLLMEGLNQSNFRGMERLLKEKPTDAQTWTFLRGQALLVGETGNLLLLRPPRNPGEVVWMERATELRDSATALARLAAAKDYEGSRAALGNLANTCNRCHQSFRVPTRITPFAEPPERKVSLPTPESVANRD